MESGDCGDGGHEKQAGGPRVKISLTPATLDVPFVEQ